MFSFGMDLVEWNAAMAFIDKNVDRASMYAIRQAGREIRADARTRVPVNTGRLKGSISNAKRFQRQGPHEFTLSVGPHGSPVYLYSGKIEGITPYMDDARNAIEGRMGGIYETAVAKVLVKFA